MILPSHFTEALIFKMRPQINVKKALLFEQKKIERLSIPRNQNFSKISRIVPRIENIWRTHFFFVFQFLEKKGERQQSWRDEWNFSETIDSYNHSKIEPDGMLAQFSGPKADSAEVGRLVRFFLFKALIWEKFRHKLGKKNWENEYPRFKTVRSTPKPPSVPHRKPLRLYTQKTPKKGVCGTDRLLVLNW